MAPEHSATPGASRRVSATYRGVPLADEPLLLEATVGARWFLHSAAPLPVGTTIACAAATAPAQCLVGRVLEVIEPRRKARGNETTIPGMVLELEGDPLAFPDTAPAPAQPAPPAPPSASETAAASEVEAAPPAADAAPSNVYEVEAAPPAANAEPSDVYEVEAAPPAAKDGAFEDLVVLEAAPPPGGEGEEDGAAEGDEPADDQAATADDDAKKKKKRRRRKR
jgi:hypothetical protein